MHTYELTDDENLALEALQERGPVVYADTVVQYVWRAHDRIWSHGKALRIISRLVNLSLVDRLPRASLGWGQGWEPGAYRLRKEAQVQLALDKLRLTP